jgi:hypothetical protein
MENEITTVASRRYQETWDDYKRYLSKDITCKLSVFCRSKRVNYAGMCLWLSRLGLSVSRLKKDVRPEPASSRFESVSSVSSETGTADSFVSLLMPSSLPASKMEDLLQGICLVFPDGVTVNIKKCLPEGLMKLIRQYYGKSEEGGEPCSL